MGYSPQGHKESDTTEMASHTYMHIRDISTNARYGLWTLLLTSQL